MNRQFLTLADALAERLIALSVLKIAVEFQHQHTLGSLQSQVCQVVTDWTMDLVTSNHPALMALITDWPFEQLGYYLDFEGRSHVHLMHEIRTEKTLRRMTITDIRHTLTLRGHYIQP